MTSTPAKNHMPEFRFPIKLNSSLFKNIASTKNALATFNFFDFGNNNKDDTNENDSFLTMENLLPGENRTILDSDLENFASTDITASTNDYISTTMTDLIQNTTNKFNDTVLTTSTPFINLTNFENAEIANTEQQSTTSLINMIKENITSTTSKPTVSEETTINYIADQINNLKKRINPIQMSPNGSNNELFPKVSSQDTLSIFLSVIIPVLITFTFIMIYMWIRQRKKSFQLRHNINELYSIKPRNQDNKGYDVAGMIEDQICSAVL